MSENKGGRDLEHSGEKERRFEGLIYSLLLTRGKNGENI